MSDLLQEALIAQQKGDIALAKQLISQALIQNPSNEAAWMLMADVVEDIRLRRNCLERVLAINPNNTAASTALTKLNTSPLSPISRGERDKPIIPPKIEKAPPFTPPFTWEGEPAEYLALGDMTYPNLPGEPPSQPLDTTPTFDWANESEEPDKTIEKIFDAISNPDLASQPLPDTDLSWQDTGESDEVTTEFTGLDRANEPTQSNDQVGRDSGAPPLQQPTSKEDFTVSAEPELGLAAFTSPDQALETVTPDYRLWDHPKAKTDRIVILSNKSIAFTNPKESDIPHILGLFAENKILRDLLGENTGTINLADIRRLTTNPKKSNILVEYVNPSKKLSSRWVAFSNPQARDEFLEALHVRLGVGYTKTIRSFGLADKIIPPLVTFLFIAFLAWGLIYGVSMLSELSGSQLGSLQELITSLQSFVSMVGEFNILIVALVFGLLTLIWLLNNLRQPSKLIILQH